MHDDILQELNELHSPLANMPRTMPYAVPDGYFNGMVYNISYLPFAPDPLIDFGKEMPYELSAGYFTAFQQHLIARIGKEEETTLPKTMMPFVAPANYFDNLPAQILRKAKQTDQPVKKTKTISLATEIWKQVRWAAAAILILGIGLGSLKIYTTPQPLSPETALSKLPETEINAYVDQHIDDFDTDMIADNLSVSDLNILTQQLDDKEISEYLQEN